MIRKGLVFVCILFFTNAIVVGQNQPLGQDASIWRLRAEIFSNKAIEAFSELRDLEKGLYFAELGDAWSKYDKGESLKYFEKSVDVVFFISNDFVKENRQEYFAALGKILKIIGNKSPVQTKRLTSILEEKSRKIENNDKFNADALITFAISLVNDNPDLAAELGVLAFNFGQPSEVYELFWRLNKKNKNLGKKVFDRLVASAANNPNVGIANTLKMAAFPELIIPNAPEEMKSSAGQKATALSLLSTFINDQKMKFDTKQIENCVSAGLILSSLLPQYLLHLPSKHSEVSDSANRCLKNKSSDSGSTVSSRLNADQEITVEVLLDLAADEKEDIAKRTYYLFRAVALADDQKRFELALSILNRMSEEERKSDITYWESLRHTVASNYALSKMDSGDFASSSNIINDVPANIRAFAALGLGLKCQPTETSIQQYCSTKLQQGVEELGNSSKGLSEKINYGMAATGKLGKLGFDMAAVKAFEKMIATYNLGLDKDKKEKYKISQQSFDTALSIGFLIQFEQTISSEIGRLKDAESRINGYISLLKLSLEAVRSQPETANVIRN